MDVIGAGFGRTGTLSLKTALEKIGFGPCAHMIPVLARPDLAELWHKAAKGDRESLDKALAGHRSTVDWPGTFFWRELVEQYPDAKVVLSVRDPEKWYDSAYNTIFQAASAANPPAGMEAAIAMSHATVWDGTFEGRFADRDFAIGVFNRHIEDVRREVPADRLLEFEVAQGWEPLCGFLEVPVPEEPFPRLNDTAAFKEMMVRPNNQA